MTVITAFTVLVFINAIADIKTPRLQIYAECAATGLYLLAIVVLLMLLPCEKMQRLKRIFIFGSVIMLLLPLLIVTPIGSRCFFAPYIMMIYLALELYGLWEKSYSLQLQRCIKPLTAIAVVGLCVQHHNGVQH